MGFLDRVLGQTEEPPRPAPDGAKAEDPTALQRYRYLLFTASPDAIEQAHAEAFAQLTQAQRAQVLRDLTQELPTGERVAGSGQDDPQSLARMATRAEVRKPGTLERAFDGRQASGLFGGNLLSSIAGAFVGSAIANQLLGGSGDDPPGDGAEDDDGDTDDDGGDFGE